MGGIEGHIIGGNVLLHFFIVTACRWTMVSSLHVQILQHSSLYRIQAIQASFRINRSVLVCLSQNPSGICLREVWRFDVDLQSWDRLEEPPWTPRRGAIPVVCEGANQTVPGSA